MAIHIKTSFSISFPAILYKVFVVVVVLINERNTPHPMDFYHVYKKVILGTSYYI